MFWVVLVFRLCVSSCACVSGLFVFRICVSGWVFVSGMGFGFCFRLGLCVWAVIFLLSFFVFFTGFDGQGGLWLCNDFYGFDGGCGCGCGYVLVVE